MNLQRYKTSLEAWEGMNEVLLKDGLNKTMTDILINIEDPRMPLDLNLGRLFNYTYQKWSNLLRNYIVDEGLKEVKRLWDSGKRSISHNFANKHKGAGKACLSCFIVSKRQGKPNISFTLRASEVTKRLLCDLVLFWRIGKYIFGDSNFTITLYINQAYSDGCTAFLYFNYKSPDQFEVPKAVVDKYNKFKEIKEVTDITYKIYRRVYKVLRPDKYTYPETFVRDCKLFLSKPKKDGKEQSKRGAKA